MSQKGGIVLILLILIVGLGLALGAYFITKNTGFLPSANMVPASSPQSDPVYQNPFNENSTYQNPFDSYENPFENL